MRMFHLMFFILFFNVSVMILSTDVLNVFPGKTAAFSDSGYFTTATASARAMTATAPTPPNDFFTNFSAFLWTIMFTFARIFDFFLGFFIGFQVFLTNLFQCNIQVVTVCAWDSTGGVATTINILSAAIYFVMAIGIIEFASGRSVNS
jgi:hypothetical protein